MERVMISYVSVDVVVAVSLCQSDVSQWICMVTYLSVPRGKSQARPP